MIAYSMSTYTLQRSSKINFVSGDSCIVFFIKLTWLNALCHFHVERSRAEPFHCRLGELSPHLKNTTSNALVYGKQNNVKTKIQNSATTVTTGNHHRCLLYCNSVRNNSPSRFLIVRRTCCRNCNQQTPKLDNMYMYSIIYYIDFAS